MQKLSLGKALDPIKDLALKAVAHNKNLKTYFLLGLSKRSSFWLWSDSFADYLSRQGPLSAEQIEHFWCDARMHYLGIDHKNAIKKQHEITEKYRLSQGIP